jgi:hypothetical protein
MPPRARARTFRRADGALVVRLDCDDPVVLPPLLAELFVALATPHSHDIGAVGGGVGFKSAHFLIHRLGARLNRTVTRRDLRRALRRLNQVLDPHGHRQVPIVDCRRGVGWRLSETVNVS